MGDKFGITMSGKFVTSGFKSGFDCLIIEEFAIKHRRNGTVFVVYGLFAIREANNAESAIGERNARGF